MTKAEHVLSLLVDMEEKLTDEEKEAKKAQRQEDTAYRRAAHGPQNPYRSWGGGVRHSKTKSGEARKRISGEHGKKDWTNKNTENPRDGSSYYPPPILNDQDKEMQRTQGTDRKRKGTSQKTLNKLRNTERRRKNKERRNAAGSS